MLSGICTSCWWGDKEIFSCFCKTEIHGTTTGRRLSSTTFTIKTHAESVAFYGGENREASHIMQRFEALVGHLNLVRHENWWFGMIQDFFLKYFGATVAVVLIIEPFFSGNLRPDSSTLGRAEMLSNLRYHTSVIISLFQSLGILSISSRHLNILRPNS
uniref:ABC transmembrane type-1 domain-containing protein n=1 Tax=Aegilops tauschii subsp. strangulata TaxID=200361 RepID=A0A453F9L5_AEGTS